MKLSAHQSLYAPWLGHFDKIARSDLFLICDTVQYQRHDFNARNRIKTHNGVQWLTVPVHGGMDKRICDVEIVTGNHWVRKHMRSIELAYRKAPHFEQYYAGVGAILDLYADGGLLVELNTDLLRYFMRALCIQVPLVKASDYHFIGHKSKWVLDFCKQLGADEYLFGTHGKEYADVKSFRDAGIRLVFQEYEHPVYTQLHGAFEPRMSIVDLLMNAGPASLAILTGRHKALA